MASPKQQVDENLRKAGLIDRGESVITMPREGADVQKELKDAFAKLTKLDHDLVDLRKPVNEKVAEIKGVYDALEKKGLDRKVVKLMHKSKGKWDKSFRITWNSYTKSTGEQLPLFEVDENETH